jgi:AraC family transcriptional regulator
MKLTIVTEPKIIAKNEIKVVGLVLHTSFKDDRHATEIPPFFHKVLEEGKLNKVPNRIDQNQLCIFRREEGSPDFDYIMGVEVSNFDEIPEGMEQITLPKSVYVSMTIVKRGPEDVGKGFGYLMEGWLPESGYVPAGDPFIYYDDRFFSVFNEHGYDGNPVADINIPVKYK